MSMITASGKTARWVENYCVWLSKPLTNCSLLIILLAYWCVSVYGILNVKPDLADNKFFLKDSSLLEAITYREQYILPKYTSVTIFVSEPGNMGDKLRRNQLEKMMSEFESLPECNGAQFSRFWIRDYEKFIQASEMDEDDEQASDQLKMFVDWPEYSYWGGFMRFDNDTGELVSFFSTVAYHGEDLWQPTRRTALLNQWRAIADNYSEFSVTIYEDEAPDLDALDTLVTSTFKNSFITLLCMALVVLVFMASISSLLITLISVTSICSGVFGLVSLWGIDIDAFSMTALVISIGLSVDFPAHVIYHYYRTEDSKSLSTFKHRMQYTISSIGFPLFQCSGSSVLFVGCLLFIPCYLSEVRSYQGFLHY
ncbi:unnamed protein product [Anisakis simplex]|uniref:SSD domain-containing protein n=1 Tax=Anisakis simplex TaxID=6269 RepID=A0A0M3K9X1_ANISI|nr:unnamed protein product [Anisakis simplex]